ncbi:class I SAM-dependent methyltransferase [Pseudoalteromonas denitrificans]|uniref:Predicted methyltransferase n=1 Tax=Pseudoalteromonas denitrificans DSM 6059 TaxID=1123010 RepID=A0A1I1QCR7_9GAMM|nr:class I SAM-dependent methyltransferase [Pseudoalteromonas denitrificans]SFD19944.1 Predicted methyltransferase [Pseudoalteromonas denitrificans DSM 6059]
MSHYKIKHLNKTLLAFSIIGLLSGCNLSNNEKNEAEFTKTLQSKNRSQVDKNKDIGRKPQQVMQFFDIKPGMTVLEILSSGGYYTEVLSHRVGDNGKVIAQNNKFILEVFEGRFAKEFEKRTANNKLPNVEHYITEFGHFNLKQEVDVATIVLNYHDMYSNMSKEKRLKVLMQIKTALKPGGILGIIDMESAMMEHQPQLHRIHHQHVLNDLNQAGFILDAQANFLKNDQDDHSKIVFDPSVRGKTDRFVFRFKKPIS